LLVKHARLALTIVLVLRLFRWCSRSLERIASDDGS
jgi:hypothetical protein